MPCFILKLYLCNSFFPSMRSCLYSPHGAYAQSKLALVLFSYQLQHLLTLEGSHVTVNVVDPGVVNTDLYQHVCWAAKMVKWMTGWLLLKVLGNPLMVPHHSDLFCTLLSMFSLISRIQCTFYTPPLFFLGFSCAVSERTFVPRKLNPTQ